LNLNRGSRNYRGSELDPWWLNRVSKLSAGLEIGEFRKIVT